MLPKVRIKLVLEPIDRVLEVLGGVIMVLTFTSALSVSRAGEADVHEMLIGSLGCNLAWGIIDAIMYLMNCLAARGREHDALRAMRSVRNAEEGAAGNFEGAAGGCCGCPLSRRAGAPSRAFARVARATRRNRKPVSRARYVDRGRSQKND
jgi:hypothetical protein